MHRLLILTLLLGSLRVLALRAEEPVYEFRGVWVATVTNIDWPSQRELPVEELKKEALRIIELHHRLGMNALILQVRPSGDAIYPTPLAPWSVYLTGEQGKAPGGDFDPLQFWIDECHKRGMELHAWINPFRASLHAADSLHLTHPARIHPEWTITHNGRLYYDPGLPQVHEHLLQVLTDLLTRYRVDGLHIDDYFYPYPAVGQVFNDSASYLARLNFEEPLSIHDWRRQNTDRFVKASHELIKELRPDVRFGVSPFGVWRNRSDDPRGSDSRAGITSYDHLYADVIKWAREGWIDYVAPQIYWSTRDEAANYIKLADWWNKNVEGAQLYIGHAIYKINGTQRHWDRPTELADQLRYARRLDKVSGSIFYSHNHFLRDNHQLAQLLSDTLYRNPALVPPLERSRDVNIPSPSAVSNLQHKRGVLTWELPAEEEQENLRFLLFFSDRDNREERVVTQSTFYRLPPTLGRKRRYTVQVVAVDAHNNMSPRSETLRLRF
ncbi:MAG TPA: family 10 glycosylhydrolase [Bacteroidales bacterium]|nr:family 10 glycosylhydrolase [Bacteroidales bacterium]